MGLDAPGDLGASNSCVTGDIIASAIPFIFVIVILIVITLIRKKKRTQANTKPIEPLPTIKEFSMKLRELRENKNLLQKDVALVLGIPVELYVEYENGTTKPDMDTLVCLANLFECSIDHLIGRSNEPLPSSAKAEGTTPEPPHEPRYEVNPPPYGQEPPPVKKRSCLPVFLLVVVIVIIAIIVGVSASRNNSSSSKRTQSSYTAPKILTRDAKNSDISFDIDYSFPISFTIEVTALTDIEDLVLLITYVDDEGLTIKTSYESFGDLTKGQTKANKVSITSFTLNEIARLSSCKARVSSGTVCLV